MMITSITLLIALIGLLLTGAVLLQNPHGGGINSTLGGHRVKQTFGTAQSRNFIEKTTWSLAIALFVLCIATSLLVGTV